jgi:CheY-like chemotaxis protein
MSFVLVVEDDADTRDMMMYLLQTHGIASRSAGNGMTALVEAHRRPRPSVILLDLMMPVMDGWEFRRRQLADATIANIPVVVISALSRDHYHDLRPAAIIPKPCDLDRLMAVVQRLIDGPLLPPTS